MANNFKKQVAQKRAAVPQVDPESVQSANALFLTPVQVTQPQQAPGAVEPIFKQLEDQPIEPPASAHHITIVDTNEAPVNRGFFMYPSRHRQIAKDIVYIEDRKPWQIIEDALEEYVIKHYGKAYKRK
ncbi:MAG TPA: hypothetical protein VFV38_20485 [Ktedonobacteraceae bacterium]|nr:hypothetical protein [Ktedonobacteraceae bacterium]